MKTMLLSRFKHLNSAVLSLRTLVLLVPLLIHSSYSMAIVKLHDVDSSKYDLKANQAPYLIDMPTEGHGILISERWLLTVGHVIFDDYHGMDFDVSGVKNKIVEVVFHPDYINFPSDFDYSTKTNIKSFLSNRSDIALVKLAYPVKHLTPIALYKENNEQGKTVEIYGKGATGNGKTGMVLDTKHQRKLRFCRNVIADTNGKRLVYQFDYGDSAIPLEGVHGSGDSGGASVIYLNKTPYLVGLSSWQWEGDKSELWPMLYGTTAYQVRVSNYIKWIDTVLSGS